MATQKIEYRDYVIVKHSNNHFTIDGLIDEFEVAKTLNDAKEHIDSIYEQNENPFMHNGEVIKI